MFIVDTQVCVQHGLSLVAGCQWVLCKECDGVPIAFGAYHVCTRWCVHCFCCLSCLPQSGQVACLTGYEWQLVRSSEKGLPARNLSSTSLASTAASDRGTDGLHSTMGHHSRPPAGSAGEAERLRTVLRQKEDQVASLQSQLTNLEATRDRWGLCFCIASLKIASTPVAVDTFMCLLMSSCFRHRCSYWRDVLHEGCSQAHHA